uniref:Predicted protein n=1 Tax=Hordeum vulgare subsp. vulgare TaxID=112509 RepID=F2D3D1_HORVV|nr:predicted protein [Hordeum vulgare subsp. vulgare]
MASSSICMIPLEERQHNFHFKSLPLSLRQLLPPIHITCRSLVQLLGSWRSRYTVTLPRWEK